MALCVLPLCTASFGHVADQTPEPGNHTLLHDGFEASTNHWTKWEKGTGTCTLSKGFYHLQITGASTSQETSVAAIYDYYYVIRDTLKMSWLHKGIEIRLRCSDDNKLTSQTGGGLRWWGFADFLPWRQTPLRNALYFQSGSPECGQDERGFSAISVTDSEIVSREPLTGIDLTQWHNYTILWGQDNSTFCIDGKTVATTQKAPNKPMGMFILTSNMLSTERTDALNLDTNVFLEIDFIHLFFIDENGSQQQADEMEQLFTHVSSLLEQAQTEGIKTESLAADYTNANDIWEEFHSFHALQAKDILNTISLQIEPVLDLLNKVNTTIQTAREQNRNRDVLIMEGRLKAAKDCLEKEDYLCAEQYLAQIIQMPEPLQTTTLLSILGLFLLPTLLRKHAGHTN